MIIRVFFALLLLNGTAAAAESKPPVKIAEGSVVLNLSWFKDNPNGLKDLDSVTFTIQNMAVRPIEWVKFRAEYKNHRGVLLQSGTFESNFGKQPLETGDAKQITHYHYPSVKGYSRGNDAGFVLIDVIDFRFAPLTPPNP
jgi:hypothetical protein